MAAPSETRIVLMGKTGNGKSSTGNSILGRPATGLPDFKTSRSATAVTSTCQLESGAIGPAGRIVHVIDTPGFFEASESQERVRDEIVKCLEPAKDGVHAFVLVLSVASRFTKEEVKVVHSLTQLFGEDMLLYMIVVFTNGDALKEDGRTLEGFIDESQSVPLNKILNSCGGRMILFENKAEEMVKEQQVMDLLNLVDKTLGRNAFKPYTNDLFKRAKLVREKKEQYDRELAQTAGDLEKEKLLRTMEKEYAKEQRALKEDLEVKIKKLKERQGNWCNVL